MRQVRYKPPNERKRTDGEWNPPLIGDMRRAGECLEVGCRRCGRHGYYDLATMPKLRDEVPVYLAAIFLRCTTCGAKNTDERDVPVWARGDCRQNWLPGGGKLDRPPVVDVEGKLEKPKGIRGDVLSCHS